MQIQDIQILHAQDYKKRTLMSDCFAFLNGINETALLLEDLVTIPTFLTTISHVAGFVMSSGESFDSI